MLLVLFLLIIALSCYEKAPKLEMFSLVSHFIQFEEKKLFAKLFLQAFLLNLIQFAEQDEEVATKQIEKQNAQF